MTDFDFDVKEKKRIAQGAYHKKNGSKSKGCHLPHEDLTAAEQKKLNGPVKTVDLDRPMTWKALKALPEDKRKLYLERLMDLYGVSKNKLAKMLGIAPGYLCQVCAQMRLDVNRGKHYHMTKQQDALWEAFCGGVVGGKPGEPKPEEPKPEEPKTITIQRDKAFEFKVDEIQPIDDIATVAPMLTIQRQRDDIAALKMELAFYKKLYYDLIDRMLGRRDDA